MQGKVCIVTGANSGIGLETARELARQGARVFLTARNRQKGQVALEDVQRSAPDSDVALLDLDLASLDSVRRAAEDFLRQADRLDVLVNNAGLMLDERRLTEEGFEVTFGVNHLGHFLLTALLRDALASTPAARVVNVSSDAHRGCRGLVFEDLMFEQRRYRAFPAYAASKLANILFTRELARRMASDDVTAYSVHPGAVGTRFASDGDVQGWFASLVALGRPLLLTPAKGARTSLHCATAPGIEGDSGGYFARCRARQPNAAARDDAAARRLWDISADLTGAS